MKWQQIGLTLGGILIFCPSVAHAYLDPGSGSYVIQWLLAGLFGGGYVLKTYWDKIKLSLQSLLVRTKDGE